MRRAKLTRPLVVLAAAATLLAAAAGPAQAHIQISPTEAAPGDPVRFELLVPGETDAHTVEVALQIPKGVLPFSFEDPAGWKRSMEEADDGSVGVVRWRGKLAADGFVRFGILASTPEREGDLVWKAVQRYDDGEEAAWIGPPDSEHPAAVTSVSASAQRQNAGGEGADAATPPPAEGEAAVDAEPASAPGTAPDDGDDGGGDATLATILGGAGLVLGAAALVVALRRRPQGAA